MKNDETRYVEHGMLIGYVTLVAITETSTLMSYLYVKSL